MKKYRCARGGRRGLYTRADACFILLFLKEEGADIS